MVERVRCAGILHDLGKIGIPDAVLQKPGPLSDDEWAEMRKHPELGAHILEGRDLGDVRQWVLGHHERPDGRGYPYGLGREQIPLEAMIVAVADAFEAMTADRVYRDGMTVGEACKRLRAGAGTQFERRVVDAMIALVDRRDLIVASSLGISGEAAQRAMERDIESYGEGGMASGQWLVEEAPSRSGAEALGLTHRTIAVRGRLAGRTVQAIWSDGRVSGDPLMVTMVDQMVYGHEMDMRDPWNFLLLMGSAVEQGTLEATGDLPDSTFLEPVAA
jgi:hypothetical protein